ncbi:MAG: Low molecular weight protein-tyrosine-phosphatase ptp [Firmicutes bacterium ADurb.Bin193]|nr:MAG: Low molecular weight protein-tyrosine-phosphatase ptp [Firmicutes bacterium ADurb.Bin193]
MKILLVCTGNTCRSPMAEGILKRLLPDCDISSAGIATQDGLSASENALLAMSEIGIDISAHKSRRISGDDAQNSDLILCMTRGHKMFFNNVKGNTFTLGEFAGVDEEVSDPYGAELDEYRACRDQLQRLLEIIAEKIKTQE